MTKRDVKFGWCPATPLLKELCSPCLAVKQDVVHHRGIICRRATAVFVLIRGKKLEATPQISKDDPVNDYAFCYQIKDKDYNYPKIIIRSYLLLLEKGGVKRVHIYRKIFVLARKWLEASRNMPVTPPSVTSASRVGCTSASVLSTSMFV